ncbi:DUF6415 family natural product biosynthesis protein [Streptomyces sp. 2RAF24]|uniref:DUF6415 family natural product biosynthesis protein n=1 Tax=Streptomyces sp. 2RAF24 TaxID=3232997 RepID=UPI003F98F2BD
MAEQHDRRAEATVEIHLGALLVEAANQVDDEIGALVDRHVALALKRRDHPGAEELATLTEALLTDCRTLANYVRAIPANKRPECAAAYLETWAALQQDGPACGPFGPWSYTRYLARSARDMLRVVRYHRRMEQDQRPANFIGRAALPPVLSEQR